jgi:hypothetical protein
MKTEITRKKLCKIPEKVLADINENWDHNWDIVGVVLRDNDTANVVIVSHETLSENSKVQTRHMIVPEFDELMEPTKPCMQLNIRQAFMDGRNNPTH